MLKAQSKPRRRPSRAGYTPASLTQSRLDHLPFVLRIAITAFVMQLWPSFALALIVGLR
jgi:hypothetical protein